mmetsp:Transcript_5685/g.15937  ORF Transcript_5685/g.15937 Transcript_5685/m.15937 type:complete len:227 (+) Transcript_5685:2102-2782(+)
MQLLQRANVLYCLGGYTANWTCHSGRFCAEMDAREHRADQGRNVHHFCVVGNRGLVVCQMKLGHPLCGPLGLRQRSSLDVPQPSHQPLRHGGHHGPHYAAVQENRQVGGQRRRHHPWVGRKHPKPRHHAHDGCCRLLGVMRRVRNDPAAVSEVVEQSAGATIRGVDWAEEAPRLGEQLADCGGAQLHEIRPTMDTPEVGEVPEEVQLLCHYCEAAGLAEVQSRAGD